MRSFRRTFCLVALVEIALVPGVGLGLTIYRIGGMDTAPPPEVGAEGVKFVTLSWEEAARGFDGQTKGVAAGPGRIGPILVSPDTNLAPTAADRGGGPAFFAIWRGINTYSALVGNEVVDTIADGDPTTAFSLLDTGTGGFERYPPTWPGTFVLDLGWCFPINRVRFYPRPDYVGQNVEEFSVKIIEGNSPDAAGAGKANWQGILRDLFPEGNQWGAPMDVWKMDILGSVPASRQKSVDFPFPTRYAEYVALTLTSHEMWEVAELEVYGEGYVPEALYQSAVLDLGAELFR